MNKSPTPILARRSVLTLAMTGALGALAACGGDKEPAKASISGTGSAPTTANSPKITPVDGFSSTAAWSSTQVKDLAPLVPVPEAESPRVRWRLSFNARMDSMAAPRKYPAELQERATRLAIKARQDPERRRGAVRRVAEQLGVNPETLRNWVSQAEVDAGTRPGVTTSEHERLLELERENRELRRANAILRSASAFFAAELDRPHH